MALLLYDPVRAQTIVPPTGSSPAVTVPVGTAACQVVDANADKSGVPHTLYVTCPSGSLRVGEAGSWSSAVNVVLGTTLVVRQNVGRTEAGLVSIGADGSARLDDVSAELVAVMIKAEVGRRPAFAIDLTRFALDGSVAVAPADASAAQAVRVDLSGYGRTTTAAATG